MTIKKKNKDMILDYVRMMNVEHRKVNLFKYKWSFGWSAPHYHKYQDFEKIELETESTPKKEPHRLGGSCLFCLLRFWIHKELNSANTGWLYL